MTLLAGIDLSSKALHCALIPADDTDTSLPPFTFRCVELPRFKPGGTTAQYRSVERCRSIRDAVRELLYGDVSPWDEADVTSVWVEEPMGARNKATNVLREIYGAVLASIPSHIERASIAPQEWRAALPGGVPFQAQATWTKEYSIAYAQHWVREHNRALNVSGFSHDHAEALLVALAGRHLTHQAVERKHA